MAAKKAVAEYLEWAMVTEGAFEKTDGNKGLMKSESGGERYAASVSPKTVFCACPGFKLAPVMEYRRVQLIKIFAVAASSAYEQTAVLKTDPESRCPDCESKNCKPYILRKTARKGHVWRHSCEDCKRYFSENPEYRPRWYPPKRSLRRRARLQGPWQQEDRGPHAQPEKVGDEKTPSHNTVSVWTRVFLSKMAEYVSEWAPSTSQIWSMDGLYMKLRKVARYLYMIMDYDARFVLAHDMGDTKAVDDVASVTGEAKRRAGDVPDIMLRDGVANPSKAIKTTNMITRKGVEKRTR